MQAMRATSLKVSRLAGLSAGVLAAFFSIYFVWGTTYLGIAVAIQTLPPFFSGGVRFLVAGGLMYVWLRWRSARRGESAPPPVFTGVDLRMAGLCGVLLSGFGNGFIIWAEQGVPSGIVALIVAAMPVVVITLDWAFFTRRAPSAQALLGVAIAIAGVATIVMHMSSFNGPTRPIHLVAVLIAVCSWALGTLLQKRHARADTVLSFTCAQMLAGGAAQLLMGLMNQEWSQLNLAAVSLASLLAMLYLIVFGSIIALNCYLWLLTRVSAQKVTTYALVNPVVALILGALILNEPITATALIATALVLLGVALVLFQNVWRLSKA
jgi:drug/metabolite transporter (DMT)-like permease